ncbi:ATP-binding protein [Cohnella sp. JJ-181]|uniref:ATP-binding protein n=1 Tax=Cohnella rhizoplanae TaxID=2974897 RepID=UPI0022FF5CD6|nr:ATP-binding protein [Cohnella sp. JJ-181]CAI6086644.1 Sensor histidine kinase RcsC [Cohnella sp. JJ-181]
MAIRRQHGTLYAMSAILAAFLIALIVNWLKTPTDYPMARGGVLDARNWDFAHQGTLPLRGEWTFYERALLEPKDIDGAPMRAALVHVPKSLSGVVKSGKGDGFGTYRLRVLVSKADLYSIRAKKVRLSSRLYMNGAYLDGQGRPAPSSGSFIPSNVPVLGTVDAAAGTVDILIQVASFDNLAAGVAQAPEFGLTRDVMDRRDQARLADMILIASLLMFGLYYAGLYRHWRRDPHLMYFSFFCLALALFFSMDNEILLATLFPAFPFLLLQKMLFVLPALTFVFFVQYIYAYMGRNQSRLVRLTPWLTAAYLLFVLLLPNRYYGDIVGLNALLPLVFFYTIFDVIFKNRDRGVQGKGYILLGVFSLIAMWVYAQFRYVFALDTPFYLIFSPLLLVLSQSLLMTDRLHDAYVRNENLNRQLIAYDRQKDEFLAKTSHELRTPLHGIINLSQTLLDDRERPLHPSHRDNIRLLHQVGRRLASLVHDILDMNKIRYGQLAIRQRPVDIEMSVRFVIQTLSLVTDKPEVKLVIDVPAGFPAVWADEDRLRQILHNLVENALKFTAQGTIRITADARGGQAAISVADTGSGMPPETMAALFRPFTSFAEEGEGWRSGQGLGLSISKQLAELQGGKLEVETALGAGSTFTVTLPLAAEGAIADSGKAETAASLSPELATEVSSAGREETGGRPDEQRGIRLLIVDDEPSNRKILSDMADSLRYGSIVAGGGKEALTALQRSPKPDLVLLDLMMPGVSGLDVCREIRKLYSLSELPVLMLTASGQTGDLMAAFEAGANDILQKPFELAELRARLQSLLAMKLSSAEAVRREMDFLQAQITPHFLYNSLNALVGLSYKDAEKLRETIQHLSTYLRAKFTFIFDGDLVPFERELELVEAYLAIERLRFGERLQVRLQIEEGFDCLLPPLILQPIVENAVRHGIGSKTEPGTVEIAARRTEDGVEIAVTDNGIGMSKEKLDALQEGRTGGVGIANVNRRLSMLYGRKLDIASIPGEGTRIRLHLPEDEEPR